jgi:hypothetical protein
MQPHNKLKKKLNTALKLVLVFLIFIGLQGRVIVRYTESFHKRFHTETSSAKGMRVASTIIHCKLQCYTQQFHLFGVPAIVCLISFISIFFIICGIDGPLLELILLVDPVPLLQLRGPPSAPVRR